MSGRSRSSPSSAVTRPIGSRCARRRVLCASPSCGKGVWTRPANLDWDDAASALDVVHAQCTWMRATPDDPDGLAAALWDLDGWATRASALVDRMHRSRASLDGGRFDAIPEGFVTSAAVLRLLRADPLLPSQLLPDQMAGRRAARGLRRLRRRAAVAVACVLHADTRPPFFPRRTRTQPGSASTSSGHRLIWA